MLTRKLVTTTRWLCGRCLHCGGYAAVQIRPPKQGQGIRFVLPDHAPPMTISVSISAAATMKRCSSLQKQGVTIYTVEHLMSALLALGIFDAEIHLVGFEVPILDGSAKVFAQELLAASQVENREPPPGWTFVDHFNLYQKESAYHFSPHPHLEVECSIHVAHPRIGYQHARLDLEHPELYLSRFAAARTYGFLFEAQALRCERRAKGATLGNVLVFDSKGVKNLTGTRFTDEPVRHKIIDALGDLALLGASLQGHVRLRKPSHRMLINALRQAITMGVLVYNGTHVTGQLP